jgi:leader peptidase (prepilin peptidase)/N-methyltransferase
MLGAFLGWQGLFLTVFLASLLGTVVGLTLLALRRGGRRTALPFGSFLAPVAVLVLLSGEKIVDLYRQLILS